VGVVILKPSSSSSQRGGADSSTWTSREVVREGLRKLTEEELAEYERLTAKAMGLSQENMDLTAVSAGV